VALYVLEGFCVVNIFQNLSLHH